MISLATTLLKYAHIYYIFVYFIFSQVEALLSPFASFTTGSFCTNYKLFATPLLKMNLSLHTLGTE